MELTALDGASRGRVALGAKLVGVAGSSAGPQLIADPLGAMKTYPLRNEAGEIYAFEMPNAFFLNSRGVARYFSRCPGVSITRIRRLFAFGDEVHVQFEIDGESFEVWEPFGDNSRYWVGPSSEPQRRRACVDRLESFVRETWPGPVSRGRDRLLSFLKRRWHGA